MAMQQVKPGAAAGAVLPPEVAGASSLPSDASMVQAVGARPSGSSTTPSRSAAVAAGVRNFCKDPSTWGEWIADVEPPAAQYRYTCQTRLAEARKLAS